MSSCCALPSRRTVLLGGLSAAALAGLPSAWATSPGSDGRPRLRAGGPADVDGLLVLAGSLHDHSTDSDGDAPSAQVADFVSSRREELGLDFLSLTEHSDFFPASLAGADPWGRSRSVTDAHSGDGFTMLRGFEWTNDQQDHLNVIESSNWVRRGEEVVMTPFWSWLAAQPTVDPTGLGGAFGGADGIGQFNHPASKGPLNWDDYAYDAGAAAVMATIEVRERSLGWYWFALAKGWTVGPVQNGDFHPWAASGLLANPTPGASAGGPASYPAERTLVLAERNDRASIVAALKARRTTASERPDLWATLRGPGGVWQGSTVAAGPGDEVELVVEAGTGSSRLATVQIVTDGVADDLAFFYGDNDQGPHSQHTGAYALQHARFVASGGRATRKGGIDTPPPGRTLPVVALHGDRDRVRLTVRVPSHASTRPDGAHFLYAIVTRADGARAVTSPLFTRA